jgi:hypothetical protein
MTRLASALAATLLLAATASAQAPLMLRYGGGTMKLSSETAARKAVSALAAEKFAFAEVTADGHARGWNDKYAVFVLCMPTPNPDLSQVLVVAAGADEVEAERLRAAVHTHVAEGKDDAKSPKRVAPADGKVPPAPVSVFVKSEERAGMPVLKYFSPVTSLVMEKMGMATKPDNQTLVLGSSPAVLSAVVIGPTANALNVKLSVVTITHGEKPAEKVADDVLSRVVKVLYE